MDEKIGFEESRTLYNKYFRNYFDEEAAEIDDDAFKYIYEKQLKRIKHIRERGFFLFRSNYTKYKKDGFIIQDLTNIHDKYLLYNYDSYNDKSFIITPAEFLDHVKLGSIIALYPIDYADINLLLINKNFKLKCKGYSRFSYYCEYVVKQKSVMTKCAKKVMLVQ